MGEGVNLELAGENSFGGIHAVRIGLVTIIDYLNLGNRLQNYALQRVLEKWSSSVTSVDILVPRSKWAVWIRLIELAVSPIFVCRKIVSIIGKAQRDRAHRLGERRGRSVGFSRDHIRKVSLQDVILMPVQKPGMTWDFMVAGSDQIWNPHFRHANPYDFLTFVPPAKRVSYAASFGVSHLPKEYHAKYRTWLNELAHLSVREHAGARIIKELTGRDAEVHPDPTMLITVDEWRAIAKRSSCRPERGYVLFHCVGEPTPSTRETVRRIAELRGWDVVDLADVNSPHFEQGPQEFIDYVDGAQCVVTDSFHSAVFSLLFSKPFVVVERGGAIDMSSRFDTLLGTYGLQNHRAQELSSTDIPVYDTESVARILASERSRAWAYLDRVFGDRRA